MPHKERIMNTILAKPLALSAGLIGIIQAIAWTTFSVICICCYMGSIIVDLTNIDTYNGTDTYYYKHIYAIFLYPDNGNQNDNLVKIKPREFFIFMWFYVVFSSLWIILSGTVIWAMIHNQLQLFKYILGSWSTIVILTSVVDIVFISLLACDYKMISDNEMKNFSGVTNIVCYGIIVSLAARGYFLWLVNLIFAIVMLKFVFDVVRDENRDTTMPIIHGYDTTSVNPPWFNSPDTDLAKYSPKIERIPQNNHGFERSQSFYPTIMPLDQDNIARDNEYMDVYNNNNSRNDYPENVPQNSFAAAIAEKVATIGKNKGKRSPINIVRSPVIPPPDYTPPASPNGLRSVLRSKSKY